MSALVLQSRNPPSYIARGIRSAVPLRYQTKKSVALDLANVAFHVCVMISIVRECIGAVYNNDVTLLGGSVCVSGSMCDLCSLDGRCDWLCVMGIQGDLDNVWLL